MYRIRTGLSHMTLLYTFAGCLGLLGAAVAPISSASGRAPACSVHADRDGGLPTHTIVVGPNASTIVVDSQTQRGFVLRFSGTDRSGNDTPGHLVIFDTHTLAVLHTLTLGVQPTGLALDVRTNRVFVVAGWYGADGAHVLMLDARSGAVLRTFSGAGTLVLDDRRSRVFIGAEAVDARTGELLGTFSFPGQPGGMPVASALAERAGRFYVALTNSDEVSVFDAAGPVGPRTFRGTIRVHLGANAFALAVDERTNRLFISLGCCFPYGIGVADVRTGKVIGTLPVGGEAAAMAVDARTQRLFTTWSDPRTGGGAGTYMINLNGPLGPRATWSQSYDLGGDLAIDERTGTVVIGAVNCKVAILDGKSLLVRQAVRVGCGSPLALAIDAQRGKAYVSSATDGTVTVFSLGAEGAPHTSPTAAIAMSTPLPRPTAMAAPLPTARLTPSVAPPSCTRTQTAATLTPVPTPTP